MSLALVVLAGRGFPGSVRFNSKCECFRKTIIPNPVSIKITYVFFFGLDQPNDYYQRPFNTNIII